MCLERWPGTRFHSEDPPVCERCHTLQARGSGIKFSAENEAVPKPAPAHLPQLTEVEEALIALAFESIRIWRGTGGSPKYRGHAIFFPQQVSAPGCRTRRGEACPSICIHNVHHIAP